MKLLSAIVMSIILVHTKLFWDHQKGTAVQFSGFSTLHTSLSHDLIKAKVLSIVRWYLNRDKKTYLCSSENAIFFNQENKKYDSYES